MEVEMGRIRNKEGRFEMRGKNNNEDEVDGSMGNIKISIPPFKGMSDSKAYLEWENKVELIFECHNYSEKKKVKIVVLEFADYAITW